MSYTDIFMKCVDVILKNEGGYVNNKYDPGGETNMGICKRQYPHLDIPNLTRNQAILIYHSDYWSKMNLHGIRNEKVVLELFDMGVNAGPVTAIKMIQRLVGADVDGVMGPQTKKAINLYKGDMVTDLKQERKKYYFTLARKDPEKLVFISGWLNRVEHTQFIS